MLGWIFLLTEKKTKREDYGLCLHGKLLTALVICVYFLAVKTAMVFLSMAMQGGDSWAEYLAYWRTSAPWVMAVVLVPNFFLSFLPFFGEEYGWRYYLTPALQGRFGARRGALAVGVLWGLWHLPLNLFFYSPDTSLQSIAAQLVVCASLSHQRRLVYMMKLHLSTLFLNFFYFFNNIYKLSSDKQFCQAEKIIRFAAQLYTE